MSSDFYEYEQTSEAEKHIRSREAFGKLIPFLRKYSKGLWICLIILAGATILSLYWPILLKKALDVDIANSDFSGLIWTVVLIGLIQLFTIILQYIMRIKLEIIGQDVMLELKRKLFHHILC